VPHLVVIAGPANSGKMPLAQRLIASSPPPVLVHRDLIRQALVNPISEGHLSIILVELVEALLAGGYNVVTVSQNLDPLDKIRWSLAAQKNQAEFIWLDTRDPTVHRMIPPLQGWEPARFED
jgi:predicted kinase